MSSPNVNDVLISLPIYMQLPPRAGDTNNRHVLISVHLMRVGLDNVRLEVTWNTVEQTANDTSCIPRVVVPRRPGVQMFIPRDPFDMPLYVVMTRRNRFGTSYHVAAALQLYQDATGTIEVVVEFFRVRKRNVRRSTYMRVVRGGEVIPAEQVVGDESCEVDAGTEVDNAEMYDGTD